MDRVNTGAAGNQIPSASWNTIQDNALGIAQASGVWITRPTLRSTGGNTVIVGATAGLVLGTSTVLPAKAETTFTAGSEAAGQYYVYAYPSGGVITYEISTTAPDAYQLFKTGDTTRRYVGSGYRWDTSHFYAFSMVNGRYLLSAPIVALSAVAAQTTLQTLALTGAGMLPAHVRHALFDVSMRSGGDANNGEFVVANAAGTDERLVCTSQPDGGGADVFRGVASFEAYTDASRQIKWRNANPTQTEVTSLWLAGWQEP